MNCYYKEKREVWEDGNYFVSSSISFIAAMANTEDSASGWNVYTDWFMDGKSVYGYSGGSVEYIGYISNNGTSFTLNSSFSVPFLAAAEKLV